MELLNIFQTNPVSIGDLPVINYIKINKYIYTKMLAETMEIITMILTLHFNTQLRIVITGIDVT